MTPEQTIRAALSWCEETPNGERHQENGLAALATLVRERDEAWEAITDYVDGYLALDGPHARREKLRRLAAALPEKP